MKLSKQTIEILENLSTINKNFIFKTGSLLKSCSPNKGMAVEAKIDETFTSEAGIANLSKVLSCLKSFTDSEIFFNENSVKVANTYLEASFATTAEDQLTTLKKDISFNSSGISLDLKWGAIQEIVKYSNLMKSKGVGNTQTFDTLTIDGNGELITARVKHSKQIEDESLTISLGESSSKFRFTIPIQYLNLIQDDYSLEISNLIIIRLCGKVKPITYYFASNDFLVETKGTK